MRIPFKNDPLDFNQRSLFPSYIFDLLPDNHDCFVYDDIFRQIDISSIEKNYSYFGQNAYDPRLIVGILIYAYSKGVFSSRQIEKRCHEDLSFMYISHRNCPNFRVLSDFRKDNPDFLKECFIQSALLAKELGMVSFGHVSLDGSKFKANSSKHKAMSYEYLKLSEEELVNQIKELMAQADQCDQGEDEQLQDKTGSEIPDELKIKKDLIEFGEDVDTPIDWMLLTTVPTETFKDACQRIAWYSKRWGIEVYHRTLKSGCRIEDRRLASTDRLEACLAIDCVVAWRIYWLTKQGRETPSIPCDEFLNEAEWQVLWAYVKKQPPPAKPPPIGQVIPMIASLGGYLNRKADGPAGTTTMWRGLVRLQAMAEGFSLCKTQWQRDGP